MCSIEVIYPSPSFEIMIRGSTSVLGCLNIAAGISSAGNAATHSAILKGSELQPHFCSFIHRGGHSFVEDAPSSPAAPSFTDDSDQLSRLAAASEAYQLNVSRRNAAMDKSLQPALYASTKGCNHYNVYRGIVGSKL